LPEPQSASPRLDDASIVAAYARWAPVYDPIFGVITGRAIRATMAAVNALPEGRVLEVGVGTGISLPHYRGNRAVTGIDISPDMLKRAEARVREKKLARVERLAVMDASDLGFADGSFDAAVAMFVMTVVPDAPRVMGEMVRVVKPGGHVVIVNHFSAAAGLRAAVERWMSRYASQLGWHPEFDRSVVLGRPELTLVAERRLFPAGLYTLLVFRRD
jgi:phosphatidylethanolamine/phosphatidyl-N-methylethanolamine N-methyltransferase